MKKNRLYGFILLLWVFLLSSVNAESFLPSLNEVYGVEIPSFTDVVKRFPVLTEESEQSVTLTYPGAMTGETLKATK